MKKLTNKKGFTLVEMLVVIAIIAVLVAIIIPTVSSSTSKAAAATNAANLRSMLAEATTDYLAGVDDDTGFVKVEFNNNGTPSFSTRAGAPAAKKVGAVDPGDASIILETGNVITCKYGDYTIDDFTDVAENGGTLTHSTT